MASATAASKELVENETNALTDAALELKNEYRRCSIEDLPAELVDKIVRFLPIPDRLNIRCVSERLDAIASFTLEFHPLLNKATLESCKNFLSESNNEKYYKELLVGNLSRTDCSWLKSCNLEKIESLRFDEQITQESLDTIRILIKNSPNLHKLFFKKYNFRHFHLKQLNETAELDKAYQQISHLTIIPNRDTAYLGFRTFNCEDLAKFTSLKSLDLLQMGSTTLRNVSTLPLSLKNLQLTLANWQISQLILLLDRLSNLEKLVLYSGSRESKHHDLVSGYSFVPLNTTFFSRVLHHNKIKSLRCYPIQKTVGNECITSMSTKGPNIVDIKTLVVKHTLMVKIKRREQFKLK